MGIKGLLQTLKGIENKKTLEEFRGKRVAIDGYSWLHKAVYGCGYDICISSDYTKFLESMINKIATLKQFEIHVVIVYDGDRLPSKDETNDKR
jgi:exonuclease-1